MWCTLSANLVVINKGLHYKQSNQSMALNWSDYFCLLPLEIPPCPRLFVRELSRPLGLRRQIWATCGACCSNDEYMNVYYFCITIDIYSIRIVNFLHVHVYFVSNPLLHHFTFVCNFQNPDNAHFGTILHVIRYMYALQALLATCTCTSVKQRVSGLFICVAI